MSDLDKRRLEAQIEDVKYSLSEKRKLLDSLVGTLYSPIVRDEIIELNYKLQDLQRELVRIR